MARDKTTKKGFGPMSEGAPRAEVKSAQDSGVKKVARTPSTRPGITPPVAADSTRPGVGPDSSPLRNRSTYFQDSEPSAPVSRRDMNVSMGTERGVGKTPVNKKLSTKPGVAPAPPTSEPPPPWDDVTQDALAPLENLPHDAALPGFESLRDEHTPVDGDYGDRESSERAQFRTAPGGGRNRISGGRAAAAAYMSPTTLPPGHGAGKITAAVKVHEKVKEDARTFATEPSLLRRRESSLPPPLPPEFRQSTLPWAWIGGSVVFLLGTVALGWLLLREPPSALPPREAEPARAPANQLAAVPENKPPVDKKAEELRNDSIARPMPVEEAKEQSPSSATSEPAPSQTAPSKPAPSPPTRSPQLVPAASPKPSPPPPSSQVAPPKPTEKKNPSPSEDPWLE